MPRLNARNKNQGFTLAEQAVLIAVMGVILMIAVPSLSSIFDRFKLDQAIVSVRGALQESQRQAIRLSQACIVSLDIPSGEVTGPCLVTGDRTVPEQVDTASNIKPTKVDDDDKDKGAGNDKTGLHLKFGVLGTAEFKVEKVIDSDDPSGKFVFYMPETAVKDRKCIAISNTLGLTRVGVYSGSIKHSKDISKGTCTAIE